MTDEYGPQIQRGPRGEFEAGEPLVAGSIFGFDIETRPDAGHLVTLYVEDDGCWHYKTQFDIHWYDDLIEQLKRIKAISANLPP